MGQTMKRRKLDLYVKKRKRMEGWGMRQIKWNLPLQEVGTCPPHTFSFFPKRAQPWNIFSLCWVVRTTLSHNLSHLFEQHSNELLVVYISYVRPTLTTHNKIHKMQQKYSKYYINEIFEWGESSSRLHPGRPDRWIPPFPPLKGPRQEFSGPQIALTQGRVLPQYRLIFTLNGDEPVSLLVKHSERLSDLILNLRGRKLPVRLVSSWAVPDEMYPGFAL